MNKGYEVLTKDGARIVRGLGHYVAEPVSDCREIVKNSAKKYGNKTAFKFKKDGMLIEKSYQLFDHTIDELGTSLHFLGLKGSKISVISENRYEWCVAYYSIINGTGIGVPLDKYLPQSEIENLIIRAESSAIFYSSSYQEIMVAISNTETTIKYFICMDDISLPDDKRFISMSELVQKGNELMEKGDRSFIDAPINRDEMSILLFTSGTTKGSKGVMLSHSNVASNVTSLTALLEVFPTDVHLSLLPLHHTFENSIGLMFMVHKGITISYSEGIKHLAQNLKEFKVTILVAVPAIYEALYSKIIDGIEKSGKAKLVNLMTRISNFLNFGIGTRRKLFKSVLDKLGPDLRLFVSGAAPLNVDIVNGLQRFGVTFLQGFGLTETSPVISATTFFVNTPGTVGIPVKDVEVKIDDPDENGMGEILTRGGNVMLGYYENPEESKEVLLEDGWFRTGDLGIINDDATLKITGRAKSMIVFTNGKKAFPEEYEILLNALPIVKDSFAWGYIAPDGNVEVCAKLILDKAAIEEKGYKSIEQIGDELEIQIKQINKQIPQYKIIRYFVMSYEDLVKTTTLKIKRPVETGKMNSFLEKEGVDMRKVNKKLID